VALGLIQRMRGLGSVRSVLGWVQRTFGLGNVRDLSNLPTTDPLQVEIICRMSSAWAIRKKGLAIFISRNVILKKTYAYNDR
jgi:hypothetical protein